ncbi:hypothetical protein ACA910_021041 [Epithemia clementina (nom. ined.)]
MTQFAHAKARAIVQLCNSIQISSSLFEHDDEQGEQHHGDNRNNGEDQTSTACNADKEADFDDNDDAAMEDDEEGYDDDEEQDGKDSQANKENDPSSSKKNETLGNVLKKCYRLSSQASAWEGFKYAGISQEELAEMILHMIRLVTTCLVRRADGTVVLWNEPAVGYIQYHSSNSRHDRHESNDIKNGIDNKQPSNPQQQQEPHFQQPFEPVPSAEALKEDLQHPFALPSPAREALLSVLSQLLSNKGPLRSASNAALFPKRGGDSTSTSPPLSLILHWQVLLRLLLRTVPSLDEYESDPIPQDSSSRVNTVQKRTVQFIRDARRFFPSETTAEQVWSMVRSDTLFHSHTHACYRGTILLYLFLPSCSPPEFYRKVLPDWLNAWTNIDRCPEYDFLWMALFCRARKYLTTASDSETVSDATPPAWSTTWCLIRRRLLTLCQYWCLLPIGGTAPDKSWIQAPHPRSRACPSKLKALATAGSSYEEGIDFVAKIAKLLVSSLGGNDKGAANSCKVGRRTGNGELVNTNNETTISEGTADILRFLSYVAPYFHPSNLGSWTFTLGAFLHYFCYELACRVGTAAGLRILQQDHKAVHEVLAESQPAVVSQPDELSQHEIVVLIDALVPLCQQALYSKNGHVSRASEAAMLYLVQIDPQATAPAFYDFGIRALDVQAVHSAHQAPAALSALTRLIQPTLRRAPAILLQRLPNILRLTLAGIDSNDQNKTIRTLIFYRTLASWIPIGANPKNIAQKLALFSDQDLEKKGIVRIGTNLLQVLEETCKSAEYLAALSALPANSLLRRNGEEDSDEIVGGQYDILLEESGAATGDWVLEFLERIFELLRASGEREKASKRSSGVASRHSSADVNAARNFSRVLKESLFQVFVAMEYETFEVAARAVKRFVEEESLPAAAKDVSLLCQAVAAARGNDVNPGLEMLIPVLTDDLARHSTKTAIYRVRCLAGSVRFAGKAILRHNKALSDTLDYCFKSDDRALFKTGCKLLRHLLSTLTEPYPLPADSKPRVYLEEHGGQICLGKSAELADDPVQWHVPNGDCVEFAWEIMNKNVLSRLEELSSPVSLNEKEAAPRSRMLYEGDVQEIRRTLRLARYSIRGGASILVDEELPVSSIDDPKDVVPHEIACHRILEQASDETRQKILLVRRHLCSFLVVLASIIGSDTLHPDGMEDIKTDEKYSKTIPLISRDAKVCKETCDIALLLLTRRGASFRSQEAMSVWKAQKQISNDYTLCAQVSVVEEALQAVGMFSPYLLFKDGEDAGKSTPRRVLVSRVHLFHNAMIRNSSFEVPRRMRRQSTSCDEKSGSRVILFKAGSSLPGMLANLESVLVGSKPRPLDAYEGILDGLHALCCHSNTQVRASAIGVVDYALTRFGWFLKPRIGRLLSAMSLQDAEHNVKFGIPSCALLTEVLNNQGKRKRLSEAMKGVCSILALQRTTRFILGSHKMRRDFMKTLCETDKLISLMPSEEVQKMIHYMQNIFSPFRSKNFWLPRPTKQDKDNHDSLIKLSISFLTERKRTNGAEQSEEAAERGAVVHWRKLLQACWFLLVSIDQEDIAQGGDSIRASWKTCVRLIETEKGQPLQRVALGLLAKLSFLSEDIAVDNALGPKFGEDSFCKSFAEALVYDHKEDSSYAGGHDAQWSTGVEDIIREASRFLAPRNLFPFQRTSLSSGSFKVAHCQLVAHILTCLPTEKAEAVTNKLLNLCKEMVAAPPNEDQKNQQVTSAEIFAAICRYYITSDLISEDMWKNILLPHFDDAIQKLPFGLTSAYSDALRFSLQFCNPSLFHALIESLVEKIVKSLWQTTNQRNIEGGVSANVNGSAHGTDGFNAQSKWLYLTSCVLVELDITESDGPDNKKHWYQKPLTNQDIAMLDHETTSYQRAWDLVEEKLMPRLLDALGHPFHNCRDHISRLLFRICNCNRKRDRVVASRANIHGVVAEGTSAGDVEREDPGFAIVRKISTLNSDQDLTFLDKYNALNTARRFLSYCLHLGEAKFELTDYVIPVLPTVFESLKSTVEESIANAKNISQEEQAAWRSLEAEVTKGFRYSVSEISQTTTSPRNLDDVNRILSFAQEATCHTTWQVRQASAHFLRCFHGAHKFLLTDDQNKRSMTMVADLLSDERREVCSAALPALTGLLTGLPTEEVAVMVDKYVVIANRSKVKRKKALTNGVSTAEEDEKEVKRARNQQTSVFFLCAAVMAQPYETPSA